MNISFSVLLIIGIQAWFIFQKKNATAGLGFTQCDIAGKYKLGVIQVECTSCVWMLRIVS